MQGYMQLDINIMDVYSILPTSGDIAILGLARHLLIVNQSNLAMFIPSLAYSPYARQSHAPQNF